ncbi:MAG TPA: NAD-dependent epimerase/dehydratase family protein [Chitinispirillaceae bacterium]|nr:NAD-dependent epimerase/dehydratase family protein [Chitinispirillaceae bacterium]
MKKDTVVITGGAGFIGTNLAHRFIKNGNAVIIVDNLSRAGSKKNLQWLNRIYRGRFKLEIMDLKNRCRLEEVLQSAACVYHLAAQVAVTKSLEDPVMDFETNLTGTLNILEILRKLDNPPFLLFTSTNKVYGNLQEIILEKSGQRYTPSDRNLEKYGVDEKFPLDFYSPYGCSKGAADQYVLDYSRTFGIPAAVFRMSCIYGPHQFGTEDQGWVAHFLIKVLMNEPIIIFGDGCQVRDILYIDDLVDAMVLAYKYSKETAGLAFTIGGGPNLGLSLNEFVNKIHKYCDSFPQVVYEPWRLADQKYYVSNIQKFRNITGWFPKIETDEGIDRLFNWLQLNRNHISSEYEKEKIA